MCVCRGGEVKKNQELDLNRLLAVSPGGSRKEWQSRLDGGATRSSVRDEECVEEGGKKSAGTEKRKSASVFRLSFF